MTEALRLYFVVLALGFPDVELGISGAVFVALIGSLLTAVPLSPAGLGIVEAGDRRRPDRRLRRAAARGDRDRPPRPRDQRLLDHRPRLDRLRRLAEAARHGRGSCSRRRRRSAATAA